jgi:hypothetical protein
MTLVPKREMLQQYEGEGADLFDYRLLKNYLFFVIGAARRRKLLAFSVLVLVIGGTIGALAVLPRTYHVEASLLAQRNQIISALGNPGRNVGGDDVPLRAASETVMRHDNLVAIVKQTDLVNLWPKSRAPILRLKDRVMERLRGPESSETRQAVLVGLLLQRLNAKVGDGTVTISVDWPDGEMGVRIVEAAQQNFLEARHVAEISMISEAISILESHALQLRGQIDNAVKQIGVVRSAPIAEDSEPAPDNKTARLQVMLEGKLRTIKDLEDFHSRQLAEMQARLTEQRQVYSELHPVVVEIRQRLEALQKQEPAQLASLREEESDLKSEIAMRTGFKRNGPRALVLGPLPSRIVRIDRLARETESGDPTIEHAKDELHFAMTKYGAVLDRIDSAQMELVTARAAFKYRYSVIAPAEVPRKPLKPKVPQVVAAGVFAGLALALFAAAAADIRKGRIVEGWQVTRYLGLDILADVHMPGGAGRG